MVLCADRGHKEYEGIRDRHRVRERIVDTAKLFDFLGDSLCPAKASQDAIGGKGRLDSSSATNCDG